MKITIESTEKIVHLNGIPARVWHGYTESGIEVHAFITRIGCAEDANDEQFIAELTECKPPSIEIQAIPNRLII